MNNIFKKTATVIVLFAIVFNYSSCVKKEFDEPPVNGIDPPLRANITIMELKALWPGSGIIQLTNDYIISGIVVGDDETGNFYKSVVIEDETAGINIQIDQSEYWRTYQIGRRVFVKCQNLFLGDYGKQVQLGGYIDYSGGSQSVGRIPQNLIGSYLFPGQWGLHVEPKIVNSIADLDLQLDQNKLVTIRGVYFAPGSSCVTYADIAGQTSGNRDMNDLTSNKTLIVRTSNFADFAASLTPNDTGIITGVLQRYNSDYQLVIHELSQVQITGTCCTNPSLITIDSVRKSFVTAPGTVAPQCVKIHGIVISDKNSGNITSKNLMLQDNSTPEPRGIIVRFLSSNTFNLGDEIEIDISGDSITKFSGALQLNYVDIGKAKKLSSNNSVTPRVATVADIAAHFYEWESTLVKIQNVTLNSGNVSTYSGSKLVTDGTSGTLYLYTSSGATFAGTNHPATASSITGYLTPYNSTYEIEIRNLTDVIP